MGAIITMETGLFPFGFLVLSAKEFGNGLRILRIIFSEIARKINKAHKLSSEGTVRKSRKKGHELGSKEADRFNNRGQHSAVWRWGCFTGRRRKPRVPRRAQLLGSDRYLTEWRKKKTEQVPPCCVTEAPHASDRGSCSGSISMVPHFLSTVSGRSPEQDSQEGNPQAQLD